MKKTVVIVLLCTFFLFSCKKETTTGQDREIVESIGTNEPPGSSVDPQYLTEKINSSSKITLDIFFAISVLHQEYMHQFDDQIAEMSDDMMQDFINKKKVDFFKTIKYSEEEYEKFSEIILENPAELNSYIEKHPEYLEYLSMP